MVDSVQYQVDSESLQSAQNFLIQFLRDSGYSGSLEDGTSIYDTVIRPMSLLLSVFRQDQEKTRAYLSLSEAERLKDNLGEDYDDAVDALMSNWFVSRKSGTPPEVCIRLYFTSPMEFIEFKTSDKVAEYAGVSFYPKQAYTFYTSDFTSVVHEVENTLSYYVDVDAVADNAVELSESQVEGAQVTGTVPGIYFLRARLQNVAKPGTLQEDSDTFISRTREAVTTRELITDRAKKTVLMDTYPGIKDVYVAGHGDPEQVRDKVEFQEMVIHVGNKSDIFVQTGISTAEYSTVLPSDSIIDLSGRAVLDVVSVINTDTGGEHSWTVASWDTSRAGSLSDHLMISVVGGTTGDNFKVAYLTGTYLDQPTGLITDPEQRVGTYDPLVKEKFPVSLSGDITVQYDPNILATRTQAAMQAEITRSVIDFTTSCTTVSQFSVSSLISYLHAKHSYITRVNTPLQLTYALRDPYDFSRYTGTVNSTFEVPAGLSDQFSSNTVQLFTDSSRINIVWP